MVSSTLNCSPPSAISLLIFNTSQEVRIYHINLSKSPPSLRLIRSIKINCDYISANRTQGDILATLYYHENLPYIQMSSLIDHDATVVFRPEIVSGKLSRSDPNESFVGPTCFGLLSLYAISAYPGPSWGLIHSNLQHSRHRPLNNANRTSLNHTRLELGRLVDIGSVSLRCDHLGRSAQRSNYPSRFQ